MVAGNQGRDSKEGKPKDLIYQVKPSLIWWVRNIRLKRLNPYLDARSNLSIEIEKSRPPQVGSNVYRR